jgi:hypothetical protein
MRKRTKEENDGFFPNRNIGRYVVTTVSFRELDLR